MRRVLIIDDDVDAAQSLAMLVGRLGVESRVAHDGLAGLEIALEQQPDVVFLDLLMPFVDGYETCRRLRRQPNGHRATIVAVTGSAQALFDAGMAPCFDLQLLKPAPAASIERIVVKGARRRRYTSRID
jgi:CheY-like chemotaxis protein